jgi:glutathione synthase/RimK-type ligase-like ATP-grasp enzyme
VYVHLIVDQTENRPAVALSSDIKQMLPKFIEYAGKSVPVSHDRGDKFVNASTRRPLQTDACVCRISEALRQSLKLPKEAKLHYRVSGDKWVIGPCVGIYLNVCSSERPFGQQTAFVTDLAKRAANLGVDLVVLTPGFMHSGKGYRVHTSEGVWRQEETPMPDIVLRRSGAFTPRYEEAARTDFAAFANAGRLHTLPRTYSNKWNMHQLLRKHREVAPFLPRTSLARSATEVYQEAVHRGDVYVKPLTGAKGISVFHMYGDSRQLTAVWESMSGKGTGRKLNQRNFSSLSTFSRFWRGVQLKKCVVQDTVKLPLADDGRPFDFRWLVQYTDEAHIVARVGRMGHPHAVTTNLHTGGKPLDAVQLMARLKWQDLEEVIRQMDALALNAAGALRREYGPYAELGIDLAVTSERDIRLFEVNPTPGRRMLRSMNGELRKLSLDYLLEYAIKAAGFSRE